MTDEQPRRPAPRGLCDSCEQARGIVSSRGTEFILCRLSVTDDRFRRYPLLPVLACPGYVPADTR